MTFDQWIKTTTDDQLVETASIHMASGGVRNAAEILRALVLRSPNHHLGWDMRGACLQEMGQHFDAWLHHDRAISLAPGTVEYYLNRGAAITGLDLLSEAVEEYQHVLARRPRWAVALANLASVYRRLGRVEEARDIYLRIVDAAGSDPASAEAHFGLATCELELGNFYRGWAEYEWRHHFAGWGTARNLSVPQWRGERGVRVLLYTEQGYGDAIQFIRYAPILAEQFECIVHLEVRSPLLRLALTLKCDNLSQVKVHAFGDQLPEVDRAVSVMSLPHVLGNVANLDGDLLDRIPARIPYLHADPARVATWREKLAQLPNGLRVGICWAGMSRSAQPAAALIDARRSTALHQWAPLASVPGISWVSLQPDGVAALQATSPPPGMVLGHWPEEMGDWADTAALVAALDLVITVDTAIVHLAGALGVPTWLLSRFDGCWRWMRNRSDSPWYPTVKIFRQRAAGDWDGVMGEVATSLRDFISQRARAAT